MRRSDGEGLSKAARRTYDALLKAENAYTSIVWHVKVGSMALASVIVVFFLAIWLSIEYSIGPSKELGVPAREILKPFCALGVVSGFPVAGLAVLPTDERAVRTLGQFMSHGTLALGITFSILATHGSMSMVTMGTTTGWWIEVGLWVSQAGIGLYLNNLFTRSASMAPCAALSFTWATGHHGATLLSNVWIVYTAALTAFEYGGAVPPPERALGYLVLTLGPRLLVTATSAERVQAFQALLQRRTMSFLVPRVTEGSVASLGALLSPKSALEALEHGQRHFRAIGFSSLDEHALSSLKSAQALFARTEKVALGECDGESPDAVASVAGPATPPWAQPTCPTPAHLRLHHNALSRSIRLALVARPERSKMGRAQRLGGPLPGEARA